MPTRFKVITAICFLLVGCTGTHPDGWYLLTDPSTATYAPQPIVTAADFATLRLDSFPNSEGRMVYQIVGSVKEERMDAWADATEKAVGRQIGFLYRGEIISAPRVNMRIDSGRFAISSQEMSGDGRRMRTLYEHLKQQMEKGEPSPPAK